MFAKTKYVVFTVILTLAFLLAACAEATPTEDPSLKITEVAATVNAELTRISALTPSVTPTIEPTVTPSVTMTMAMTTPTATRMAITAVTGDNAKFDKDVTIPDGTMIAPGKSFEKTWSVLNTGTTTWTTDYQLVYLEGPQATTLFVKLKEEVAPGELAQITVKFTAPSTNGLYTGWWTLNSASGYPFGEQLSVVFYVGTETATPTSNAPTGSATPSPTATTPVAP